MELDIDHSTKKDFIKVLGLGNHTSLTSKESLDNNYELDILQRSTTIENSTTKGSLNNKRNH